MSEASTGPVSTAAYLSRTLNQKKTQRSVLQLVLLGVLAGAYIGFGAQYATTVTHDLAPVVGLGLSRLVGGITFSIGIILVLLAGAELFTGNALLVLSVLDRQASVRQLLRNWGIVYFANFAGALLLVLLVRLSGLDQTASGALGSAALSIANTKVDLTFLQAFTRGILCNWLVCLAIWMASQASSIPAKILAAMFPVTAFVVSGFEHSVANMYFIPLGIALRSTAVEAVSARLTVGGMFVHNLLPVTLGNIVGGALFVAMIYWMVELRPARSVA